MNLMYLKTRQYYSIENITADGVSFQVLHILLVNLFINYSKSYEVLAIVSGLLSPHLNYTESAS